MIDVKMDSVTQILALSQLQNKTNYFVLLLMSYQTTVRPSFIQIQNSAATDFVQI
jgi:hypothetical protein